MVLFPFDDSYPAFFVGWCIERIKKIIRYSREQTQIENAGILDASIFLYVIFLIYWLIWFVV